MNFRQINTETVKTVINYFKKPCDIVFG
jgi:hypothetical protein